MHALLLLLAIFLCSTQATVFEYTGLYSAWNRSHGETHSATTECTRPVQVKPIAERCERPPAFSPTVEQQFLRQLNLSQTLHPEFTADQKEAIRLAWPVLGPNRTLFKNVYCAKCRLGAAFNRTEIERIPAKLVCKSYTLPFSCFLGLHFTPKTDDEEDESEKFPISSAPRWDEFFLPIDDYLDLESPEVKAGGRVYEILQLAACIFSFIFLIAVICVYGSSKALIRKLPGKMMFSLCCSFIGTLLAFAFSVSIAKLVVHYRWICLLAALLLPVALLATFTWMALFGVELLMTFGVLDALKSRSVGTLFGKGRANVSSRLNNLNRY